MVAFAAYSAPGSIDYPPILYYAAFYIEVNIYLLYGLYSYYYHLLPISKCAFLISFLSGLVPTYVLFALSITL